MVPVCQQCICCYQHLHPLKCFILLLIPLEFLFSCELRQWCKNVSSSRPDVTIIIYHAQKQMQLSSVLQSLHADDSINLLFPRFNSRGGHPVPQEIHFLYGPFTFKGVYQESCILEPCQNLIKQNQVRLSVMVSY